MAETFIPVVQVECNQMPSHHDMGIPRFINRGAQPMMTSSAPVHGVPNTAISNHHPVFASHPTMPHVPPASIPVHQPPGYHVTDHGIIIKPPSPPSPSSVSSTVSSVSVYEDCISIPTTSPPRYQPESSSSSSFYPPLNDHVSDLSGDHQPRQLVTPFQTVSTSSIPSDVGSNSSNHAWIGGHHKMTSSIKPEQAMAMVNEKLRDRIAALEKKIHRAISEVTFLGDRNWRLEAHVDALMHTLEVLGVTDIEDLTGKTLPLPMFRVKVKAGYRLGPFNRLPRRAVWSYDEDCKKPPNIDLSSDRARTVKDEEYNDCDDLHHPAGTDIGLSVRQMFHYEQQIEELRDENHTLSARVTELTERESNFQDNVKKVQEQYAELQNECEETKAELNCVAMRLHNYDGPCRVSRSQPHGEDMGDHCIESHIDHDYHQPHNQSRVGPYYRRARGGGGIRDGRRYRNVRGR